MINLLNVYSPLMVFIYKIQKAILRVALGEGFPAIRPTQQTLLAITHP